MRITISDSGFFDVFVACPNEKDASPFLKRMAERGYIWLSGTPLTAKTEWQTYGTRTVYHLNKNGCVSIARSVNYAYVYQMREFMDELSVFDTSATDDSNLDISMLI